MSAREYMDFRDPDAQIERNYRDSHPFQWAREALQNAIEAGAKRVAFDIEWQGVRDRRVYRRTIIDDGFGLSYDEMPLFNAYGGSGKPTGGEHENFGIGFKSSVLPWNHEGVVVISLKAGKQHMMWLDRDPRNGRYGSRYFRIADSNETIVPPFIDEQYGVDWSKVLPDWVHATGHGTALVLLGNTPQDDSILGAPDRDENQRSLTKYLNTRYFDLQNIEVNVAEFQTDKKSQWPLDPRQTRGDGDVHKAWQYRTVKGALHYMKRALKQSSLLASDVIELSSAEQANLHWYLRNGEPLSTNVSEQNTGFVALLYRNELWNYSPHSSTMRRFGIGGAIAKNLFLIIEPREYDRHDPQRGGFYPNNSRTQLLRGGSASGKEAPIDEWSDEFRSRMPRAIIDAINAARPADDKLDDEDLRRLKDRFGARWRIPAYLIQTDGIEHTRVIDNLIEGQGHEGGGSGTRVRTEFVGETHKYGSETTGALPAKQRTLGAGLPECKYFPTSDFEEQWMLANYVDRSAANPAGLIELNQGHPVLLKHIDELSAQYAEADGETIARVVREAYRRMAIAHVAHSEQFKTFPGLTRSDINRKFRSPEALTMALLGLISAEAIAGPELGGRLGRKLHADRRSAAA